MAIDTQTLLAQRTPLPIGMVVSLRIDGLRGRVQVKQEGEWTISLDPRAVYVLSSEGEIEKSFDQIRSDREMIRYFGGSNGCGINYEVVKDEDGEIQALFSTLIQE